MASSVALHVIQCVAVTENSLYGMHPVVTNGTIYTTISTNVNEDKTILIYHLSFTVQRSSATCFGLQEVIIRHTRIQS
jgi:hypothetical protein